MPDPALAIDPDAAQAGPSLAALFVQFLRLGTTAFGGPAMIPYMRDMAVIRKAWVSEQDFRLGVAACQSLPGATAMQVAAYVGLRSRGLTGGLTAYAGFALPAFVLITALSAAYAATHEAGPLLAVFAGLKAVVCALMTHAALNFARRHLQARADTLLALGAGLVFGLGGNPIWAIAGVCAAGVVLYRDTKGEPVLPPGPARSGLQGRLGLLLAAVGLGLGLLRLASPGLFELCVLMMKVDLFAFGGGYVSLPLMLHEVVEVRAWMSPEVFMDGIALGQVTPGPIVITSAFVGYLLFGLAGAVAGGVSAFTPSFLILAGVLPVFDRLRRSWAFQRAVRASLASLAGLMAAISGRFLVLAHWSPALVILAVAALVALRKGVDVLWVVIGGALAAALIV